MRRPRHTCQVQIMANRSLGSFGHKNSPSQNPTRKSSRLVNPSLRHSCKCKGLPIHPLYKHNLARWAGQGRAGQGRAGQGRAGQGRAGQGRAGQGTAGQGRAGTALQAHQLCLLDYNLPYPFCFIKFTRWPCHAYEVQYRQSNKEAYHSHVGYNEHVTSNVSLDCFGYAARGKCLVQWPSMDFS